MCIYLAIETVNVSNVVSMNKSNFDDLLQSFSATKFSICHFTAVDYRICDVHGDLNATDRISTDFFLVYFIHRFRSISRFTLDTHTQKRFISVPEIFPFFWIFHPS